MSKIQKTQIDKESDLQVNLSNFGMTISQLNDDCLKCILTHLSFKDKLILQRVSKRWQKLMPWECQKKLEIDGNVLRFDNQGWISFSPSGLENALHLCGNFMQEIETSYLKGVSPNTVENWFKGIKKACPNLVSLDLKGFVLTKPLIELLIQNFTNLKSISIGELEEGCEKKIAKFFSEFKNIYQMKFEDTTLRGKCLKSLPLATIEKLIIVGSDDFSLQKISTAFQEMSNLSTLEMSDNLLLIQNIDKLLEKLPNKSGLKILSLHLPDIPDKNFMIPDFEMNVKMNNLCHFTNLQEIALIGPQVVHDEALIVIGNNCTKLKTAVIAVSHKLTDNGLKNFAKLTNLETLKITQLSSVSEKCLRYLQAPSLKNFVCHEINLTNESLQGLLKSSPNLISLDVALCPLVNLTTLINNAFAYTESRPNHEILKLGIEMDGSISRIENVSSRLKVEQTTCYLVHFKKNEPSINLRQEMEDIAVLFS